MFSKISKAVLFSLFSLAIVGCANGNTLKQGQVVVVENKTALVYVETLNNKLKGQRLKTSRLMPTGNINEGDEIYAYQEVGKVRFEGGADESYAHAHVIEGNVKQGDMVNISSPK